VVTTVGLVGGGLGNLPVFQALRRAGYRPVCFPWPGGNVECLWFARALGLTVRPLDRAPDLSWDTSERAAGPPTPFLVELAAACRELGVDHLFAFGEDFVFAFAVHRELFAAHGVAVHVPPVDRLASAQNRASLAAACVAAGIPAPRRIGALHAAGAGTALPVIAKRATSFGGLGVRLVRSRGELAALRERWRDDPAAALYEYVPGDREPSLTVVFDQRSRPVVATWLRKIRYANAGGSTCVETISPPPDGDRYVEFLRSFRPVGLWSAQLKWDPAGRLQLIEVNTRPGQNSRILYPVWDRLGVPWLTAMIEPAGTAPVECVTVPAGIAGLSPVEDLAAFVKHVRPARNLPYRRRTYLRSMLATPRHRPVIDAITGMCVRTPRGWQILGAQFVRSLRSSVAFIPYGELDWRASG
jgi:hypothetical protein